MAQGLTYAVTFDAVATATSIKDMFEVNVPSDAAVVIHAVYLGQTSDMGDSASEALTIQFVKGHSTSGSGGSAPTPVPLMSGFPAAGTGIEVNNTTIATSGTAIVLHQDVWNVQLPYQYRPTPEERLVLSPSQRMVVRLSAPADALTISGTLIFEEVGG